ncbi:MAG: UDP-N-acetylmuramoyl-L-alanine--D-glutamate ligase [Gammaproteobacteria bacterium]
MSANKTAIMNGNDEQYEAVVVGLGKTGLSCARYLAARGIRFAVNDSRAEPPELPALARLLPEVPVFTGGFDAQLLCRARRLILSPGVAPGDPAIRRAAEHGVEMVGDIELFTHSARAPVVAVTGSNGKSTVASLVAAMVKEAGRAVGLGGNIGTPALDLLAQPPPDYYVLELSSFQLETVQSLNAAAAAVLNISPDHLDRYPDVDAYAAAKRRIYAGTGVMVVNLDDARVQAMAQPDRVMIGYSLSPPAPGDFGLVTRGGGEWLACGTEALLPVTELRLSGRHNLANVLAALGLGSAVGLPLGAMLAAARTFTGLAHRCRWLARVGGVDWVDDSKGTNVGAACAAVTGLGGEGNLILIAGGDGKGADFAPLAEAAAGRVRAAVLIGRDASLLGQSLEAVTKVVYATDMAAAVTTAASLARTGDTVLLSPACASFDMFRDYRERGEVFAAAVRALDQGDAP